MSNPPHQPFRLPQGGRIDRSRAVEFSFNDGSFHGYHGDTLASALLANGVRVVARSFKYHRPRGIFTAGEEEPCAIVEIGDGEARLPNCRATTVPLSEGLVAGSQSGWPGLHFDLGRIVDLTHPLWPAGFYNKTFKWPRWQTWEPLLRRAAGVGRAPSGPDPDRYEQVNAHCDLLICGGGPAGLSAGLVSAAAGLRVLLAEQDPLCGGVLNRENMELDGQPGWRWARSAVRRLRAYPNVVLLERTAVTGVYDHNVTTLLQSGDGSTWRECLWTVRPRRILLATGAIEQGLLFPDNDRPGIMLAGAVRHYLNRHAVLPGTEIVVATNNDSAYQTVFDLADLGKRVSTVVDSREAVDPKLSRRVLELGAELFAGARIGGTGGSHRLRSLRIAGRDGESLGRRPCDLLAVSGGWAPRVHLLAHAGGTLKFDRNAQAFLPDRLPSGGSAVGAANGTWTLQTALDEAHETAVRISTDLGQRAPAMRPPRVTRTVVEPGTVAEQHPVRARRRQWIDLAHDVTLGDAELAVREGYVPVEHFKRYTTTGMSVDQGKTGNLNAFIVLAGLTDRSTGEIGTTTFRPPYVPVSLGALAGGRTGEFYAPRRLLPAHTVHERIGARFDDYGWTRPECYPVADESRPQAVRREVLAVRSAAGVFDNSPIGKLDVRGPDAARFLDRVYANDVTGLAVGRARYGLMLNENGVIIDDGVLVRLAEEHFLLHTTSGAVERIGAWLEELLQSEWKDLRVLVDDQTLQWATFTIAGPRARDILGTLGTDVDTSAPALPHMAIASGRVSGQPARIARISYSGELSFEVSVPARAGGGFLQDVLASGAGWGITPFGVESLMLLRMEKGYLHVGTDTDGSSTPDDVGWGPTVRKKAGDFIGRRSLEREANLDPQRRQFVGFESLHTDQTVRPGAHLLIGPDRQPPAATDGWITSAGFSPTLERPIALGLLRSGRQRMGEIVTACDGDERLNLRVVPPRFYDPENRRLKD